MSCVAENALIIQSDRSVLLEVHSPRADAARAAIAPFAELIKSPEHLNYELLVGRVGVAPTSPAWKAITLIHRPFRARCEQGCVRRSTVKLPASVWCSGAGVAPASPAIKGGTDHSDNP